MNPPLTPASDPGHSSRHFLVTSAGAAGSIWLAGTLNAHPEIVCSCGAGPLSASMQFEGRGSTDIESIAAEQVKEILQHGGTLKSADAMFDELETVRRTRLYGNVHLYTVGTYLDMVAKHGLRRHPVLANVIRHPVPRTEAKYNYALRSYACSASYRELIDLIWRGTLATHPELIAFASRTYGDVDTSSERKLFLVCLADTIGCTSDFQPLPSHLRIPHFKFEDLKQRPDCLRQLIAHLSEGQLVANDDYLARAYSSENSQKGRLTRGAAASRPVLEAPEQWNHWPDWQRGLFLKAMETARFHEPFEKQGYDFSFVRATTRSCSTSVPNGAKGAVSTDSIDLLNQLSEASTARQAGDVAKATALAQEAARKADVSEVIRPPSDLIARLLAQPGVTQQAVASLAADWSTPENTNPILLRWAADICEEFGAPGRGLACREQSLRIAIESQSGIQDQATKLLEEGRQALARHASANRLPNLVFYNLTNSGASAVDPILRELLAQRFHFDLFGGPHLSEIFMRMSWGPAPVYHWTHSPMRIFEPLFARSDFRFVCLYRDPRDVLVSHIKDVIHQNVARPVCEREVMLGYIRANFDGMFQAASEWLARDDARIFKMSFEELKADVPAMLQRVLDWAGLPVDGGLLRELCDRHSFETVTRRQRGQAGAAVRTGYLYRKGISGDWRNHFDRALAEEFEEHFGKHLRAWNYAPNASWVADAIAHPFGPQPFPLLAGRNEAGQELVLDKDELRPLESLGADDGAEKASEAGDAPAPDDLISDSRIKRYLHQVDDAVIAGDLDGAKQQLAKASDLCGSHLVSKLTVAERFAALDWAAKAFTGGTLPTEARAALYRAFLDVCHRLSPSLEFQRTVLTLWQNGSQPAAAPVPRLLQENVAGFNLVAVGEKIYALALTVGAFDFAHARADELDRLQRAGQLGSFDSLEKARAFALNRNGSPPRPASQGRTISAEALKPKAPVVSAPAPQRRSVVIAAPSEEGWQRWATAALVGATDDAEQSISGKEEEERFGLAVALWIVGEDEKAKRALAGLGLPHAVNLLRLVEKQKIEVLAQSVWLPDQFDDPKFAVRPVGIPRRVRSREGWEVPNHAPLAEPYRELLPRLQGQPEPDFYFANMLEWEILPYDLQALPCPVFGVTSDFDIHLQNIYPWLPHFDELLTVGSEEQQKVAALSGRPVSVFPKMFPLPADLPALPKESRWFDLYISGTIANPYHPDKAGLLHQLLQRSNSRICYVDGFVAPQEYYQQMARCKTSFSYVRHGTSMPSRGLEALAMGCAVLAQKGSPLTLFAGEAEGVLTYSAEADELPVALEEVLRHWPEWERRARRGAAIVRREFTRSKCLSQFLRYLAVLAARPRPERAPSGTVRYQKRGVLRRGHSYSTPVNLAMVLERLRDSRTDLSPSESLQHTLNQAREVDLFLSGDLPEALRTVERMTGQPESAADIRKQLLKDREQLRKTAAQLYGRGMREHPDSLVVRFNAFRHAVHLGRPEDVPAALSLAEEIVRGPRSQWRVAAMDDVFPWDYHATLFNYRAYLDAVALGLANQTVDEDRLKQLILASLHSYLGLYRGEVADFEQAAALDPEFPFYRFRLAQALERRAGPGDFDRAAQLLMDLALNSMMIEPACAVLVRLMSQTGLGAECFAGVESVLRRLRAISETSSFASKEYDAVALVLPPEIKHLPLESAAANSEASSDRVSRLWQSDRWASHRTCRPTGPVRPKILLIPFECANWQNARAWSYTGYYAFEEGLQAAGVDFVSLPAIAGFPSNHPASWLNYARRLCRGQQFDQAWIWLTHNEYHPDLLNWLAEVAPVRLGLVMESLEHTPEELALYPKLPGRRERVVTLLRHLTGLLAFDDADAQSVADELPIRTLWCPPVVPWRCVTDQVTLPHSGPAAFQGTLYSPERQAFLRQPGLKKLLSQPALVEDSSSLPERFDQLQLQTLNGLIRDRGASRSQLDNYLGELRRIRRRLFSMWLAGVEQSYATVNLPSIYKGYAGRVVESMAAGRPVVSWAPPRARTRALFEPDREILLFDRAHPEELRDQILRLQKDRTVAQTIAERARAKVLQHHTAEVRVRQILDWVEADVQPDFGESAAAGAGRSAAAKLATAEAEAADTPTEPDAWTKLARTALQAGSLERFETALGCAMELAPEHRDALKLLGDLCTREGQVKNAIQNYHRVLQSHPNDVSVLYALGFTLEQAEEWDAAFAVYDHLLRIFPQDTVLAERIGRLRNARAAASASAAESGGERAEGNGAPMERSSPPPHLGGYVQALKKRITGPTSEMVRQEPHPPGLEVRQPAISNQPAPRVAKAAVKRAPLVLPPCALVGNLAEAHAKLGKKELRSAWESATAALRARPFHPEAFLLLAQIALAAGCSSAARRCAQHARELAPGWKEPKKFLKGNLRGNANPDWLQLPVALSSGESSPAGPPRLSVFLITKNEEKFIEQCLTSVKGVADEIIVVDTGSSDRTVEIAREHGAQVHFFAWCDDFSAARNAALEHVTGDWVLMLDADEELSAEGRAQLRTHLDKPEVIAWRLPLVDVGREADGCSYVPRLFRNAPALFYVGRVHEQVFSSIEVRRQEWGLENRLGECVLRHHGYTQEMIRDRNKVERNLRLLERAIEELSDEPNLLMSLGQELARSGREPEALARYREAFHWLAQKPAAEITPELRETLLSQFATRLAANRAFAELVQVLNSPCAKPGLTASLHFALGLAHLELGEFEQTAAQMEQCLAKRGQRSLCPINRDIHTAAPFHCLAQAQAKLGRTAAAHASFQQGLKQPGRLIPLRMDYARFLVEAGQSLEALRVLSEGIDENAQNATLWRYGGQLALSRPEFLDFANDWTGEAMRYLASDPVIVAQRAEALLLRGESEAALSLWQELCQSDPQPTALAARLVCEVVQGIEPTPELTEAGRAAVEEAFLQWYRRCVTAGARAVIFRINRQLPLLRRVLPKAAEVLAQVLAEVGPAPAEPAGV